MTASVKDNYMNTTLWYDNWKWRLYM